MYVVKVEVVYFLVFRDFTFEFLLNFQSFFGRKVNSAGVSLRSSDAVHVIYQILTLYDSGQ